MVLIARLSGEWVSWNTRRGRANVEKALPSVEMVWPVRNFQKSLREPVTTGTWSIAGVYSSPPIGMPGQVADRSGKSNVISPQAYEGDETGLPATALDITAI